MASNWIDGKEEADALHRYVSDVCQRVICDCDALYHAKRRRSERRVKLSRADRTIGPPKAWPFKADFSPKSLAEYEYALTYIAPPRSFQSIVERALQIYGPPPGIRSLEIAGSGSIADQLEYALEKAKRVQKNAYGQSVDSTSSR